MKLKELVRQGNRIGNLISYQSLFWDSETKQMRMGEAALIVGVISKAIEDLPLMLSKKGEDQKEAASSKCFIFSKGLDSYADLIGLDANYIRGKIKLWMEQWDGRRA